MLSYAPRRLGVLGWPVAHSRSPAMQNAALAAVGLDRWRYQLLPVAPGLLAETVRALPGAGFRGANATIPHKQAALELATDPTGRARAIGAANTLVFGEDGTIEADNTDAPALIASLPFAAAGATAVVLGAGGSARAAVWALLDAGAAEVWIWNRTAQRARALSRELGATPVETPRAADLLVNCTSIGLAAPERTFARAAGGARRARRLSLRGRLRLREVGDAAAERGAGARGRGRRRPRAAGGPGGAQLRAVHRPRGAARGHAPSCEVSQSR